MSQQLYDLIQQNAADEYASNDDVSVVSKLNTPSIVREDHTLRTARWVIIALGVQDASLVLGTLQASASFGPLGPIIKAGYDSLVSEGLDLAHPTTQILIDQLGAAAGWKPELITKLKEAGIFTLSPAKVALNRDFTDEDVKLARAWKDTFSEQRNLSVSLANIYNTLNSEVNESKITSQKQLLDRLNELLV